MTAVWQDDGKAVPVTVIAAGPCLVVRQKTKEKDGYEAVQLGFETAKKKNKPDAGQTKNLPDLKILKEFRINEKISFEKGAELKVDQFVPGDKVKVTGISKGLGFQGVVRRHRFAGHPASHGHEDQERMPGAIGAGGVQHVRKGQRMAGRMGGERTTVRNLKVVKIDSEKNLIYLKGAVPGKRNGLLMISS